MMMILDIYPIENNILIPISEEPIELQIPELLKDKFWTRAETLDTENPDSGFYFRLVEKKAIPKEKKWKVIPCVILKNKTIKGSTGLYISSDVEWEDLLGFMTFSPLKTEQTVNYNLIYVFPEFLEGLRTNATIRTEKSLWEDIITQKIFLELRDYYSSAYENLAIKRNPWNIICIYFLLNNLAKWIDSYFPNKRIRRQKIKTLLEKTKEDCNNILKYYISLQSEETYEFYYRIYI